MLSKVERKKSTWCHHAGVFPDKFQLRTQVNWLPTPYSALEAWSFPSEGQVDVWDMSKLWAPGVGLGRRHL